MSEINDVGLRMYDEDYDDNEEDDVEPPKTPQMKRRRMVCPQAPRKRKKNYSN